MGRQIGGDLATMARHDPTRSAAKADCAALRDAGDFQRNVSSVLIFTQK
jgi:hypothetical protein